MYFETRASNHISYHEDFDKTSIYWNRSSSPAGNEVCTIQNVISDLPALMVSMIINCHEFYVWLHNFGTHFFFYLHELAQLETVTSSSYVSKLQFHIPVL